MHPAASRSSTGPAAWSRRASRWLEVGGTEKQMYDWLGVPAGSFPYRFFPDRPLGLYAIGVKTSGGEKVIRKPWRK